MKNFTKITSHVIMLLMLAFMLAKCSNEVDQADLVMRNDLVYEVNSQKPFTGNAVAYINDQLRKEIPYKNGIQHGRGRLWYANGKLEGAIEIKNGEYDGATEMWFDNGQKHIVKHFKKGVADGKHQEWTENGAKNFEMEFKKGLAHGQYTEWHENGQVGVRTEFKDGILDGPYKTWYESGNQHLRIERVTGQSDCRESIDAILQVELLKHSDYDSWKDNSITIDGKYQSWYDGEQQKYLRTYSDGALEGLSNAWSAGGDLRYENHYKSGAIAK